MKKRSGLAAIILSLSLVGSVKAVEWSTLIFGAAAFAPQINAVFVNVLNLRNAYVLGRLRHDVSKLSDSVDNVNSSVAKVGNKVDLTNNKIGTLQKGLADLDKKTTHNHEGVCERLKVISLKTDVNAQFLNNVNTSVDTLRDQVTGLSSDVSGVKHELKEFRKEVTQKFDGMSKDMNAGFGKLEAILLNHYAASNVRNEKIDDMPGLEDGI